MRSGAAVRAAQHGQPSQLCGRLSQGKVPLLCMQLAQLPALPGVE